MYIQEYRCIDASCKSAGVLFPYGFGSETSCETVLTTQCRLPVRGCANPLAGNPGKVLISSLESRIEVRALGKTSGGEQYRNHWSERLLKGTVFRRQRRYRLVLRTMLLSGLGRPGGIDVKSVNNAFLHGVERVCEWRVCGG